jgi:hypothetical protein
VAPITVTRTSVQGTAAGTANVTLSYTVNTAITSLSIKETLPSGWSITAQTSSPGATMYKSSTNEWIYMSPPGVGQSGTITYTVSGPAGDTDTINGGCNIGAGYVDTSSTAVTLREELALTSIVMMPETAEVTAGNVEVFTATAYDQYSEVMADVVIAWTSSNETVGTVSPATNTTGADGMATTTFSALAVGVTTIAATNGSVSNSTTVTVVPAGHTVSGTVKGINQETISGATVTVNGYSSTTNANGNYSITNVPNGTYTVTANATGYRNETNVSVSTASDVTIDFTGNDGLLKEPCSDTTYVLQVINKWATDEITDTTKVLTQINIWAVS